MNILKEWSNFLREIRDFFYRRGYMEVTTPVLLEKPNLDPNISPIEVVVNVNRDTKRVWLHTSPEYAMKKILAKQPADIFQITKVFRDGEYGRLHRPEFTMLEWYKIGADYKDLIEEVRELVHETCGIEVSKKLTFKEAVSEFLGFSYTEDSDYLLKALERAGIEVSGEWDLESLTDLILSKVGERSREITGLFVIDFPPVACALARVEGGAAERFELYIKGIEIANGWTEERDPGEIRKRLERESIKKGLPLDQEFMKACSQLPPCAGCSVGLERLFMIRIGCEDLRDIELLP